ncbi:MFS transporter [Naasia lichenicola]|uniref:MFS transporter n=1 Tax=Naasia lichenicola TaxID=2565933 RepID=A0A4S4FI42_9MICO|nr:MFS transporter [Naasia lichenicola]THG29980.1 MFS transporter [Naasia lichenicola]
MTDRPLTAWPLYAAGFLTAFGSHGVAAGLGVDTESLAISVLTLGILLALYDVAEVVLKPVFGALSDRIGIRPVILLGLGGFALTSVAGALSDEVIWLAVARLGQGASAAAFSPAASAGVARLAGPAPAGRYFGRYGSWKGLGYALGPLLGAGLIAIGGFAALNWTLAGLAVVVAICVFVRIEAIPVVPKVRVTVVDMVRELRARDFLIPVVALATSTAALGIAVGFLPFLGSSMDLPVFVSVAAVTVVAIASSATQPLVGRLVDRVQDRRWEITSSGLVLTAGGFVIIAAAPSVIGIYLGALLIGVGIGATTPAAFTVLASSTPPHRLGRTMGNAELGREIGDAGGPLATGAIIAAAGLPVALAAAAAGSAITGLALLLWSRRPLVGAVGGDLHRQPDDSRRSSGQA